jgi:hypothetical protein
MEKEANSVLPYHQITRPVRKKKRKYFETVPRKVFSELQDLHIEDWSTVPMENPCM